VGVWDHDNVMYFSVGRIYTLHIQFIPHQPLRHSIYPAIFEKYNMYKSTEGSFARISKSPSRDIILLVPSSRILRHRSQSYVCTASHSPNHCAHTYYILDFSETSVGQLSKSKSDSEFVLSIGSNEIQASTILHKY
jgi:hypothetical protein